MAKVTGNERATTLGRRITPADLEMTVGIGDDLGTTLGVGDDLLSPPRSNPVTTSAKALVVTGYLR